MWDDCGPVTVTLAQTIDNTGDCWVFSKTYIYHATDPCGNLRICEVTHSGTYQTKSNVVQGPTDLTCIDQVPAPDADAFLANFSNGCDSGLFPLRTSPHLPLIRDVMASRFITIIK